MTRPSVTVAEALKDAARRLAAVGIAEAPRESRLLVGHVLAAGPEILAGDPARALRRDEAARLAELVRRRARREPMSHLLGRREFWSLEFRITADTLDPRPDSETLIEAVLATVADRDAALRVLDLGTGSGCLLLALLSELPNATGVGIDISRPALSVAEENAARLGFAHRVGFRHGDWDKGIRGPFDVIVANPPYLRRSEIAALQPEIALFEPAVALDGGIDGLDCYRALAAGLARLPAPQGFAAIEIGAGQEIEIKRILLQAGVETRDVRNDLSGIARCLVVAPAAELTVN